MKKLLAKVAKILVWIIVSIVLVLLGVVVAIQIPYIQNAIKDKALTFVEEKVGTPISIERIEIAFPTKIVVKGVYVESQEKDTLLYSGYMGLDISLLKLLSHSVKISSIELNDVKTTIRRDSLGHFNFDYIIEAFASEVPEEDEEDKNTPWQIDLGTVSLEKIQVDLEDFWEGNHLKVQLKRFQTRIKEFDLENQRYALPKIVLDGIVLDYIKSKPSFLYEKEEKTEEEGELPDLKLNTLSLKNIALHYTDLVSEMKADVVFEEFKTEFDQLALKENTVLLNSVYLSKAQVYSELAKQKDSTEPMVSQDTILTSDTATPWKMAVKKIQIEEVDVRFDNPNYIPLVAGLDYNHLGVTNFSLNLSDLRLDNEFVSGSIKELRFKEKSGLELKSFKTHFMYGEQIAFLKELSLQTSRSDIKGQFVANYSNPELLTVRPGDVSLEMRMDVSSLAVQDVLLLQPDLLQQPTINKYKDSALEIALEANGLVKDLEISKLYLKGFGNTVVDVEGKAKGLPEVTATSLDMEIHKLQTTQRDLLALLPQGILPEQIQLPSFMNLSGNFKGGIDDFYTHLRLQTSSGLVSLVGQFNSRQKNKEKYRIDALVDRLDVGHLLQNDSIGEISLTLRATGERLDPKFMTAQLEGHLLEAKWNSYLYENLRINGTIDKGKYRVQSNLTDPNLLFDFKASGQIEDEKVSLLMDVNVEKVDLYQLHLQDTPFALSTKVHADLNNALPNQLDGIVKVNEFSFADGTQIYALDTLTLKAFSKPEQKKIILNSQLLDAIVVGDYELTELPNAIDKTISSYFSTTREVPETSETESTTSAQAIKGQNLRFYMRFKENPIVYQFVPELKEMGAIYFDGTYRSLENHVEMHGEIASLVYGTNRLENIVLDIDPETDRLVYFLDVGKFENASLAINKMALSGEVGNDILAFDFDLKDEKDKVRYKIAGALEAEPDYFRLRLEPEGFLLNYEAWNADLNNEIRFSNSGILANNFVLNQNNSKISIESLGETYNDPLRLEFNNFDIETVTQMIKQDQVLISGLLNGQLVLKDIKENFHFESDLSVANLELLQVPMGNLTAAVHNDSPTILQANIDLYGEGTDLMLKGNADLETQQLDMSLKVDRIAMKIAEAFSFENLRNSEGYLSGLLHVKGGFESPVLMGELNFNKVGFNVAALNADYKNINEKILFTNKGVEFDTFSIADSENNVLVFDGAILTKNYSDFDFNLDIRADNFKAISSTADDNELYYGDLFFDADIKVRGNLLKPEVNGSLGVNKGTDFTIVMPQEDPSIADREGIVEFVNQKNKKLEEIFQLQNQFNESQIKGLDASLAIQIDKEAQFTMVIDKVNGDKISIKGEGELTGGIDVSGKTTLTGKYEFDEGAYEMTFNFIRRKFEVQKGSSITWTGEPTSALTDLTAVYESKTAPIDLLENQLADLSPMQMNMYKQKLPFKTLLMMKGELLKPEISFDIQLAEGNLGVSGDVVSNTKTKLEQLRKNDSELNKQVFALLILNRFVGQNPFESMVGGMSAGAIARQSVSKLLSEQLNNLAGNLIAGVEINFDLESTEDYSTGEKENRTDLNIGVSKRLFNDRLKITVGSSFGLEGSERENEQMANIAGDLSAEYMLSKDGRYILKAYRKNEYQVALHAQVIETGLGFVITMSYEKFKELFERSREKRMIKKESLQKENVD